MYLAKYRISKKNFASDLGVTPRHLSRIIMGQCRRTSTAIKIEELTEGEVSRYDIKPELRLKRKKKTPKVKQLDAFKHL